ncbi:hypothetical protein ACEW7V_02420 [Areca yellow leaf disease phytoplasma]
MIKPLRPGRGYQRFLVRWQGRPESDDSWISREDLQRLNPDLLEICEPI